MDMTMILLMRHGETTGNRRDLIIGQKDYPLTEKGISSTEKLAELATSYNNGIILTSPLGRKTHLSNQKCGVFCDRADAFH
jgi:broad specificity phosphatase PhoE